MEKNLINQEPREISPAQQNWLDLEHLAQIELTSEDAAHPIELAFTSKEEEGWQAAGAGEQTIRFLFDEPQNLKQIQLLFRETEQDRTQEVLLRWLPAGAQNYQEIVRQQFNFSPPHTTEEAENYKVNLDAVSALEINIIPDMNKTGACASLAQLRVS